MEKLVSLCKRRGFVFPASEITGASTASTMAPSEPLKTTSVTVGGATWWSARPSAPIYPLDIAGIDSSIIQNPKAWVSGHVGGFSDPMVDCRATKSGTASTT